MKIIFNSNTKNVGRKTILQKGTKATRFCPVVRDLGSMLEVLGSILSSNVTKKRHENEILYDE
jgi:hypothetical protein